MRTIGVMCIGLIWGASCVQAQDWIEALGGPGLDRLHAAVELDGRIVLGGSKNEEPGASEGWLVGVDADGRLLFDRSFAVDGALVDVAALAVADGVFVAGHQSGLELESDVFVMLLSRQGTVRWQTQLSLDGTQRVGDLLALDDGGVLVVGSTRAVGETRADGWWVELGPDGDVLSQMALSTLGDDGFHAVAERPDGGYLLAGHAGIGRAVDGTQGWLVALAKDGTVDWEQGYEISQGERLSAVVATADGWAAFGNAFDNGFFRGDAWRLDVDELGNVIDSELFGNFEQLGHDAFVDAAPTPSGGILAVGSSETIVGPGGLSQQLWATEIGADGQTVWSRHFGPQSYDSATSMVALDGQIVLAGWAQLTVPDIHDALIVSQTVPPEDVVGCSFTGVLGGQATPFTPIVNVPVTTVSSTSAIAVASELVPLGTPTGVRELCR